MLFKKDSFALVWISVKKTSWKSLKNVGIATHLPGFVCLFYSSTLFHVFS